MRGTKICQLMKVLFILTEFLPNDYLKMQTAPASCDFSRNYSTKTLMRGTQDAFNSG